MGPVGIVLSHVCADGLAQLPGSVKFLDVNHVILDGPKKAFRSDIVQSLSLSVHGDSDTGFRHQHQIVWIGKMAALVRVDNFRFCDAESPFQASHDEAFVDGGAKLPIHDTATKPVDDDEQVHEAFFHGNIGDVNAPDLIRSGDVQVSQQIRPDVLPMIALAEIRFGIDGVQPHLLHESTNPLPVDGLSKLSTDDGCHGSITPGRIICMEPVQQAHDLQVLIWYALLRCRRPVKAAPINTEQFCLTLYAQMLTSFVY